MANAERACGVLHLYAIRLKKPNIRANPTQVEERISCSCNHCMFGEGVGPGGVEEHAPKVRRQQENIVGWVPKGLAERVDAVRGPVHHRLYSVLGDVCVEAHTQ
tara:strand:+ start:1756 stop:2067 length:312 start_codon:yes stop_codon:yes gene_type:complete